MRFIWVFVRRLFSCLNRHCVWLSHLFRSVKTTRWVKFREIKATLEKLDKSCFSLQQPVHSASITWCVTSLRNDQPLKWRESFYGSKNEQPRSRHVKHWSPDSLLGGLDQLLSDYNPLLTFQNAKTLLKTVLHGLLWQWPPSWPWGSGD